MKSHNMICHIFSVLLIVAACNAQFGFNTGVRFNNVPRISRPNNSVEVNLPSALTDAPREIIDAGRNFINEIPSRVEGLLPKLEVVPPKDEVVPPKDEVVPPRDEVVPPRDEVVPPRDEVVPPRYEVVPPRDEVVPPRDEVVPPRDEVVPPRDEVVPPRDEVAINAINIVPQNNNPEDIANVVTSQGDNVSPITSELPSNVEQPTNNENIEPRPYIDLQPENNIVNEVPSQDNNLAPEIEEGSSSVNGSPSNEKIETPQNIGLPIVNVSEGPSQGNYLEPESVERPLNVNGVSPQNIDLLPVDVNEVPSQGNNGNENIHLLPEDVNEVPSQGGNITPETVEVPIIDHEGSSGNVDQPIQLISEKDEVPKDDLTNGNEKPNDNLTPESIEVKPVSEVPLIPPIESNHDHEHGHGHGHGDHGNNNGHHDNHNGNYQKLKCSRRFGYVKIDGYCDSYVECRNYRPRQKVCPDGMYFNEKARWSEYPCGYPSDVVCRGRSSLPVQASSHCPHQYGFFTYPSEDIQQQCSQYVMCSGGVPNVMRCPDSLVFNPKAKRCDWPEHVPECRDLNFKCPETFDSEEYSEEELDAAVVRNYRHKEKCSYFWSCLRGQARMLRCDYGMFFDPNFAKCVVDDTGSCGDYYYPELPKVENPGEVRRY